MLLQSHQALLAGEELQIPIAAAQAAFLNKDSQEKNLTTKIDKQK